MTLRTICGKRWSTGTVAYQLCGKQLLGTVLKYYQSSEVSELFYWTLRRCCIKMRMHRNKLQVRLLLVIWESTGLLEQNLAAVRWNPYYKP